MILGHQEEIVNVVEPVDLKVPDEVEAPATEAPEKVSAEV